MSIHLCKRCEISLNFPMGKIPKYFNYKPVPTSNNNTVLGEILRESKQRNYTKDKFIILVDGARYGIKILNTLNDVIHLQQYVLHHNGENIIPVYVRYVKIFL